MPRLSFHLSWDFLIFTFVRCLQKNNLTWPTFQRSNHQKNTIKYLESCNLAVTEWNMNASSKSELVSVFFFGYCYVSTTALDYLSVPLQLLVELRWLEEGGLVPAVDPGVVLQPPSRGASPELASATLAGNFSRPLISFLRTFLERSNSLAAELTFAGRCAAYVVVKLSCDVLK